MTTAAIYCRISQDSTGKAAGVRRQEKECRDLAASKGWDVVEVFTDNDVSATNGQKRPALDAMFDAIRAGRVKAIVVWHYDRLYRRPIDLEGLIEFEEQHHPKFASVMAGEIDLSTASGRMTARVLVSVAKHEVERASERQKARWRQRKDEGKESNLGRRPFGFRRVGAEKHKRLVVHDAEAAEVRAAAEKLIAGASLYAVTKEIALPPPYSKVWRPQHVKRMFRTDLFVRHGVLTADVDKLVKARLAAMPKTGPGRPRRTYALHGLVRCGRCRSKLSASSGAYICNSVKCGGISVKAANLEEVVHRAVSAEGREPFVDEPFGDVAGDVDNADVLAELADIEERLQVLTEAIDSDVSESAYLQRRAVLDRRRTALQEQLGTARPKTYRWIREWAAAGYPPLMPEDRDWLVTIIESITVKPAKVRGGHTFEPDRVRIKWKTAA